MPEGTLCFVSVAEEARGLLSRLAPSRGCNRLLPQQKCVITAATEALLGRGSAGAAQPGLPRGCHRQRSRALRARRVPAGRPGTGSAPRGAYGALGHLPGREKVCPSPLGDFPAVAQPEESFTCVSGPGTAVRGQSGRTRSAPARQKRSFTKASPALSRLSTREKHKSKITYSI